MKKGLIFILILSLLFVGGILIYDFSDMPDKMLTNHRWYLSTNNKMYVLDLDNDDFKYYEEGSENTNKYSACHTYKYNNSSNIIKLDCDISNNKLYIAKVTDKKLVVTIDGNEQELFSTKDLAYENSFKIDNKLTQEEYLEMINTKFSDNQYIKIDDMLKYYKSKKTYLIALVRKNINYKNVLSYKYLSNIINNNYKLILLDDLNEEDYSKLNKKTKADTYDENKIYVYTVGNKKISLKEIINIKNIDKLKG